MANTYDEIKSIAMTLTERDRERLADELWRSLDSVSPQDDKPLSPAWKEEIERRIRDVRSGKAKMIPGEQVQAEIRKLIDS